MAEANEDDLSEASDIDAALSDTTSMASEAPADWNSDDEPPEDHEGDEMICSRDGTVTKSIRRVGRGLERPGQYAVVRLRWVALPPDIGRQENTSRASTSVLFDTEEIRAEVGEDQLPLAVEFAVKSMRLGEVAEVFGPAAYSVQTSPLTGRKLRDQSGRLPQMGKVPRKLRFLPMAPPGIAAQARAEKKAAVADKKASEQGGESAGLASDVGLGTNLAGKSYHALVELIDIQAVHMLTEDRSVSKVVMQAGRGRRTPRDGDIVTFTLAKPGCEAEAKKYISQLDAAHLPLEGLDRLLLSMKEGELVKAKVRGPKASSDASGAQADEAEPWMHEAVEAAAPKPRNMWRYDPPEKRRLDFRSTAELDAPRREEALYPGEAFEVAEECEGADGVLFLRLADDRGWVFASKPGAGTLCIRMKDKVAKPSLHVMVVLLRWRRRDRVPIPPVEALGRRPNADEKAGWFVLQKVELYPGKERLPYEIEEGSRVMIGILPKGEVTSKEKLKEKSWVLTWCIGEGTVPAYLEAAVASMRMAEGAAFEVPVGIAPAAVGPTYQGQTPLRRLALPEADELFASLLVESEVGEMSGEGQDADESGLFSLLDGPLPVDWTVAGQPVQWDDIGLAFTNEVGPAFRMALLGATDATDAGTMDEDEQHEFLERERAHGNALARLGRFPEAAFAYTSALDAVRRTALYKSLFPTETGRIKGLYSRDPGEGEKPLENLSAEDIQARQACCVALHLNLALCTAKQELFADSKRHCSTVLGAEPENAKALFRRGSACMHQGNYEEALQDLQKAAELQPQDRAIFQELQTLHQKMKEHQAVSKKMFEKVFKPSSRKSEDPEPPQAGQDGQSK